MFPPKNKPGSTPPALFTQIQLNLKLQNLRHVSRKWAESYAAPRGCHDAHFRGGDGREWPKWEDNQGPKEQSWEKAVLQGNCSTLGSFAVSAYQDVMTVHNHIAMDFHFFLLLDEGPYYVILFLCTTVYWVWRKANFSMPLGRALEPSEEPASRLHTAGCPYPDPRLGADAGTGWNFESSPLGEDIWSSGRMRNTDIWLAKGMDWGWDC